MPKRNVPKLEAPKECTCGAGAGCTDKCDRATNRFFHIIEQARELPPSSRDATLSWILDRAAVIAKRQQDAIKSTVTTKSLEGNNAAH